MTSTRDSILSTLRTRGPRSINELAEEYGITAASIRHHLSALQAEGLVDAKEVRHGVGRPHLSYRLTDAGLERFPARYVILSGRLLDEMKEHLSPEVIERMFADIASGIAADHTRALAGKPLVEKLPMLVDLLGTEGFMTEWDRVGERYRLTQTNCPYFRIGQRHPEVCTIDQTLISELLSLPVQKNSCLLNGDTNCTFTVPVSALPPV